MVEKEKYANISIIVLLMLIMKGGQISCYQSGKVSRSLPSKTKTNQFILANIFHFYCISIKRKFFKSLRDMHMYVGNHKGHAYVCRQS